MLRYTPPLEDLEFVLNRQLGAQALLGELPRYRESDMQVFGAIADEAGRFAVERVLPLNRAADEAGCTFRHGVVSTPPGFAAAYAAYCELGWPALCAEEQEGGQALPRIAFAAVNEMLAAASHAFVMYAAVNHCAATCLRASASEDIKRAWLSRLASGEVLATMCLSEPQAGSDLGLLKTRAVEHEPAVYRVSGTKVFASGGEHDLTENILHLVLARVPGAPEGTRGLSLFLVPKRHPDGSLNNVHCDGIESKMGLHGSATCVLRFDGALGCLVGELHQGLRAMFPMMNEARLLSGIQAVGISDLAFQNALSYARERKQGRSPDAKQAVTLAEHADVQRMLMTQKAWIEGGRAFLHWTAVLIDIADWHPDRKKREETAALVGLLTPIVKGFLTENAQRSVSDALQVHGGHGYVRETGIEQLARDVRVTTIYEGTTGIQAQDLLIRKVLPDSLYRLRLLEELIREWLDVQDARPHMAEFASRISRLLDSVIKVTTVLAGRESAETGRSRSSCNDYLRLAGHLVFAYLWGRAVACAWDMAEQGDARCRAKISTARFYFSQMLPEASALAMAIEAGPADMAAGLAA